MGIRKIIKKGDISLMKKSRPVTEYNARLKILLDDMRDTLAEANGVGLAAPPISCTFSNTLPPVPVTSPRYSFR